MGFVLFALIALFLLTVTSGAYVFVLACVRKRETPWLDEEKIKKTTFGKYYDYIVASNKWLKDHNAQDIYLNSLDDLKLHGFWVPADDPKGTILLAHGYRSTPLIDFGFIFEFYHSREFNLLIPHQRSHGESQGRFITFGVKESEDMIGWLRLHNQIFGAYPLLLSGISMGASTVLYLANRVLPNNVKGIIADCGFTSPKEIIEEVYKGVIRLPAMPTLWAVEFFTRVFAGFSLTEKDSRKTLANSRYPILLIHGKDDGFVPCRMSQDGFNACSGVKDILLVDGAEHGLSFVVDSDKYTKAVDAFIDTNIGGTNELRNDKEL